MKRLQRFLNSEQFYSLMQTYRHASIVGQVAVQTAFDSVREAVLAAAGKRYFTVTGIGYNNKNEPVKYIINPSYGKGDASEIFDIPVKALGAELLKPGTRLVIEVEDGER
jgi:hypothetical protein